MNVDAPETKALQSFFSAVRRRLWAGQLTECARAMLWHTGILLLVLAGIHHLVAPVPNLITLLGVVTLVLLMLIRTVLKRPTLATTAAHADREFNGHALMTTAVEFLPQSDVARSHAAKIVLRQACDAARRWRPEVSKLVSPPHAIATTLAIIPLFAGSVMLSLPGVETNGDLVETTETDVALTADSQAAHMPVDTDDVATLRSVLADQDIHDEGSVANERRRDALKNLTPYQNADAGTASDMSELPQLGDVSAGIAGTSTDDSDSPGDALARKNRAAEAAPTPARFQGRETIVIERTGSIITAGTNRNAAYSDTDALKSVSTVNVLAAASPETRTHWASLTRAQSAYARRYLAESGEANE